MELIIGINKWDDLEGMGDQDKKMCKGRIFVIAVLMLLLLTSCSGNANQGNADTEVSGNQAADQQIDTLSENTEQNDILRDEIPLQSETEDAAVCFTMEEVKALGLPEDMLAYWLVLNNKMPFASYDVGGQEFYWDEYFFSFGGLTTDWKEMYWDDPMLFTIVDMNHDGKNEIIIYYAGIARMLHYEDGMVYVCQFLERSMSPIYLNGVFAAYGGSGSGYEAFHRFTELNKDGYRFETIAMTQNNDYYEIGGVSVSEEEYEEVRHTIVEVGSAERIDYTEALLDEYLLAGLSEEELYMVKHVAVEPMTDDMAEYPMEPEVMQAYYEVLTGEREFISITDDHQKFYLNDYQQLFGEYNENYQILYFSIADMDGDGSYEVVLTGVPSVTQILHYEDGNVYSYQFDYYDEIGAMTSQGIFDIDHTLSYQYRRIVSFNEDGCDIAEVDYDGIINDDRIRYYYFSKELIEQFFR